MKSRYTQFFTKIVAFNLDRTGESELPDTTRFHKVSGPLVEFYDRLRHPFTTAGDANRELYISAYNRASGLATSVMPGDQNALVGLNDSLKIRLENLTRLKWLRTALEQTEDRILERAEREHEISPAKFSQLLSLLRCGTIWDEILPPVEFPEDVNTDFNETTHKPLADLAKLLHSVAVNNPGEILSLLNFSRQTGLISALIQYDLEHHHGKLTKNILGVSDLRHAAEATIDNINAGTDIFVNISKLLSLFTRGVRIQDKPTAIVLGLSRYLMKIATKSDAHRIAVRNAIHLSPETHGIGSVSHSKLFFYLNYGFGCAPGFQAAVFNLSDHAEFEAAKTRMEAAQLAAETRAAAIGTQLRDAEALLREDRAPTTRILPPLHTTEPATAPPPIYQPEPGPASSPVAETHTADTDTNPAQPHKQLSYFDISRLTPKPGKRRARKAPANIKLQAGYACSVTGGISTATCTLFFAKATAATSWFWPASAFFGSLFLLTAGIHLYRARTTYHLPPDQQATQAA
jgi:hypothetical protein